MFSGPEEEKQQGLPPLTITTSSQTGCTEYCIEERADLRGDHHGTAQSLSLLALRLIDIGEGRRVLQDKDLEDILLCYKVT